MNQYPYNNSGRVRLAGEDLPGQTPPRAAPMGSGPQAGSEWAFLPAALEGLRQGHEKPEQFWDEVGRLMRMAKEREFVTGAKPDTFISDEEWRSFWKAAGWPDSPDGYQAPETWAAEGVSQALAEAVSKVLNEDKETILRICHAANLTGKQVNAIWQHYGDIVATVLEHEEAEAGKTENSAARLWPENTDRCLDAARRGARHAGISQELDDMGLSNNPLVLKLAFALGEAVGEAGMPGSGGSPEVLPSGQAAREAMYRLIASEDYKNNDPGIMRKLEILASRVSMK